MSHVRALVVIACCFVMSFPALAQSASQKLFRINSMLSSGFAALDEVRWAAPPGDHEAPIERASGFASQAEASLTPDLKSAPAYGSVADRLAELKAKVEGARQLSQCHRHRDAARAALATKDVPAARAAHEKLNSLLAALAKSKVYAPLRTQFEAESKAIAGEIAELDKAGARERQERAREEAEQKKLQAAAEKARLKAEAEAKVRSEAEEKARLKAEADALARAAAEEKRRLAAEAKARAEETAKAAAEQKRLAKLEEEQRKRDEAERRRAELEEKRRAESEAKAAAERARLAERDNPARALRDYRAAIAPLEAALAARPLPLPTASLAPAQRALGELGRLDATRARAEGVALERLQLLSYARSPAVKAPLDATAVTLNAKKPELELSARAGWCYVYVGGADDFAPRTASAAAVVAFTQATSSTPQLSGFCVDQAGPVTVGVTLGASGKSVAVLGWPREKVPLAVSLRARLATVPVCDRVAMEALWRAPLPGLVAYLREGSPRGPVLIVDPGGPASPIARVVTTSGAEVEVPKKALSTAAVASTLDPVPPDQCPELGERPTRPADPVVCRQASDAAAAPVIASLKARLVAARDDGARQIVERDLRTLDTEAAKRREADCRPVAFSPAEVWRAAQHQAILAAPPETGPRPEILAFDAAETP